MWSGLVPSRSALDQVERRIRGEYGAEAVLLTASGTVALALAFLASAKPGERPRVVLPAWGCYDLMTAADAVDAEVVLYDIDPETLSPSRDSFERALRPGASFSPHAAVVAHWFGIPVDLARPSETARSAGVFLIDDAAQGVGGSLGGKPLGTGGDFGILSFGRGKGRTGGGGGVLLAHRPDAVERMRAIEHRLERPRGGLGGYAALWAQWALGRPALYGIPSSLPFLKLGETLYRQPPPLRTMPYRAAAVLGATWDPSREEADRRRALARLWQDRLAQVPGIASITTGPPGDPGWLRYPVVADHRVAAALASSTAARLGVVRAYPATMSALPVSPRRLRGVPERFPGAEQLSMGLFTLPLHRYVTSNALEAVIQLMKMG